MIVAIHQPNFLPWLGYFHKIKSCDEFVIIDDVQFIRRSYCNRAKIKSPKGTEEWVTVPVKFETGQTFNEVRIDYGQNWREKLFNKIHAYYLKSKYYEARIDSLRESLSVKYDSIAQLNLHLITGILSELEIQTKISLQSEFDKQFGKKNELNINICKHLNAKTYLSGTGAKKYNIPELYIDHNIELRYQEFVAPSYPQLHGDFLAGLSILDVLFNCSNEEIKAQLDQ